MAKIKDNEVIKEYQMTGPCEIDIEKLIKVWNNKWFISQWKDEYTLCKQNLRAGNFSKTSIKVTISEEQAKEIIKQLELEREQSRFASGSTWKTKQE